MTFDPNRGIGQTLGRPNAESKTLHQYKTINACKHPCVCVDKYGGISQAHTIYQWGRPPQTEAFQACTTSRPAFPQVAEDMVQSAADAVLRHVGGLQPPDSTVDAASLLEREQLGNFYVVANKYQNDTAIGCHSDYNSCYSQRKQPQVVLSCNLVGDGILWCGPTQNGHEVLPGMKCESMDWLWNRLSHKKADTGKQAMHLSNGCIVPIWAPENSIIVMGGTFQENMIHWTEARKDILAAAAGRGSVSGALSAMSKHQAVIDYAQRNPSNRSPAPPVRHVLTFRYIVNHFPECILTKTRGQPPTAGSSAFAGASAAALKPPVTVWKTP
jgi:hypothetical protein